MVNFDSQPHTLNNALQLMRVGRSDEAEAICQKICEAEPDNAEGHHLLGRIAFEKNDLERAETAMAKAVSLSPQDSGFLCNLGNVQYERGNLPASAESLRKAIEQDPGLTQAHVNLGVVLTELGRFDESIEVLEAARAQNPNDPEILLNLGNAHREQKNTDKAIEFYHRVIEVDPGHAAAYLHLGSTLSQLGTVEDAETALRKSWQLNPQSMEVYLELGVTLVRAGKLNEAAEHFIDPVRSFRSVQEMPLEEFDEFNKINKTKIIHDIEQLSYLIEGGKITESYRDLISDFQDVYDRLGNNYWGLLSEIQPPASKQAQNSYNRIMHYAPAAQIDGGALSPDLDTEKIQNELLNNPASFTFFDGLLRAEALAELRRFCLESTIWLLLEHDGELESNLTSGFACPLIFQIAKEVKEAFPRVFGPYGFSACWAYKYFENKSGLGVHSDGGAMSINFWITPDEANNDPNSGGLLVWDKKAPKDYLGDLDKQRSDSFQQMVSDPNVKEFKVPYRCNRALLFPSSVLHATDTIDFKPGYENNRINMTFLYGRAT